MAANHLGMEAGALEATSPTKVGAGREKKNGEVNSPTPGSQLDGQPAVPSGKAGCSIYMKVVIESGSFRSPYPGHRFTSDDLPHDQRPDGLTLSDAAWAIKALEAKVDASPDEAPARYQLAVLLLDEYGRTFDHLQVNRAREQLERAVELDPARAPSHAALGYAYDLSGMPERALASFREARLLDPPHREYQVYAITLLVDLDREDDAMAEIADAARRQKVDLAALRNELTNAAFPVDARTLLQNGFIAARGFFRSTLTHEVEQVLLALDRRKHRVSDEQLERCIQAQRQLALSFDASRVPQPLRPLAVWAVRHGMGDDLCRALLLKRLSKEQRTELIHDVDQHAEEIAAWLDGFPIGEVPPEAGAFLYLLEGVEEIRPEAGQRGSGAAGQ
jgi:tetratricopeptide (TPR) repeat protein